MKLLFASVGENRSRVSISSPLHSVGTSSVLLDVVNNANDDTDFRPERGWSHLHSHRITAVGFMSCELGQTNSDLVFDVGSAIFTEVALTERRKIYSAVTFVPPDEATEHAAAR